MAKTTETLKKMTLPCVALRQMVAFPDIPLNLDVARPISKRACEAAMKGDGLVFLICQKDPTVETPESVDAFYSVGVVARVKQLIKGSGSGNVFRMIAEPKSRALLLSVNSDRYLTAEVMQKNIYLEDEGGIRAEAMMRDLKKIIGDFQGLLPNFSRELFFLISSMKTPSLLCDFVASNFLSDIEEKQELLDEFDPLRRMEHLLILLENERAILEEEDTINAKVRERVDQNQRDFYLREQLKVIHEELGEEDDDDDIEEYYEKLKKGNYPKEVADKLKKDIRKLQKTPVGTADGAVLRNYIETCLEIPYGVYTSDRLDIPAVEKILDADHDGLEKVKERIIEYLAALKLNPDLKNQILCLVGPPGTGKTSVAISIARAMNRKFVRVSLGGIRDEADIRGHRKTYIGSMPGRIVNGLIQAGSANPLMLLDEIDKMAMDSHGDPASAMLEVLDGEQNKAFRDHFVEVPVDLSACLFIATANSLDSIPAPLLDRMEVIELRAYTREEKKNIAKNHLIPKQRTRHGLNGRNFRMDDSAVYSLIDEYTREAGVRNLERKIARCARKAAKLISCEEEKSVRITAGNLAAFVGGQKVVPEKISERDEIGVVNGMAYTEAGGDLLKVEVLALDGNGKVELTGSLGDVMKESAHAAISYIRSRASDLGIEKDFYKNKDIHIHVPEGAVPKDGPSAGVTMVTALVSELAGIPVRRDLSMTGEITLHGRVIPIGGLREKTMAAYLAGVRTILIPKDNETDLEEVAPIVKENCRLLLVSSVDEVLRIALVTDPFETVKERTTDSESVTGTEILSAPTPHYVPEAHTCRPQ